MGELFSASELIGTLLKIGKGTYQTAKFVGKVDYGAYAKSKEKKELEQLQRQAEIDEDRLQKAARLGDADAQYEYGAQLYNYGVKNEIAKDENDGVFWIKKAAESGHKDAQVFLLFFDED